VTQTKSPNLRLYTRPPATEALGPPPLRVLVVEDNADAAESLALLLRMHGHQALIARDGHAALREAEASQPDVVLLDIGLPGLDGYEVARQIRGRSRGKPPFVIAISGHADDEARRRAAEAGIDLHLAKPANYDELQDVLLRFQSVFLTATWGQP
jgi:two-component system, OmpR family, response regulator